jgi:hypothetical protein
MRERQFDAAPAGAARTADGAINSSFEVMSAR